MQGNTSKMERVKMGYLSIGNKIHHVYQGLNTIGRDKEATVIIKDLGVSHQHAILTIVHDGGHFISDFRSSNGTTLDRRKLGPLELHEIKGGSIITFSNNVQATYFKISECNSSLLDTNITLQNTQVDDTFYSANTQLISDNDVTNLPKQNATTSVDEIPDDDLDFSNINTQVGEEVIVEEIAIHDMPTQVYHNEVVEVDFHDLATQIQVAPDGDEDDEETKREEQPSTSTQNTTTTQRIPQPDSKEDTSIHEAETQPFEWHNNCEDVEEICAQKTAGGSAVSTHETATKIVDLQDDCEEVAGNLIHEAATQIVELQDNCEEIDVQETTENLVHEAGTQIVELQDNCEEVTVLETPGSLVHEAATQNVELLNNCEEVGVEETTGDSVHEAETQIFELQDNCEEGIVEETTDLIHEAATQIVELQDNCDEEISVEETAGNLVPEAATFIENAARQTSQEGSEEATQLFNWNEVEEADTQIQELFENPSEAGTSGVTESSSKQQSNIVEVDTEAGDASRVYDDTKGGDASRLNDKNESKDTRGEDSTTNIELQDHPEINNSNTKKVGDSEDEATNNESTKRRVSTRSSRRNEGDQLPAIIEEDSGGSKLGKRRTSARVARRSTASKEEEAGESSVQLGTIIEENSGSTTRRTRRSASRDRARIKEINQRNFGRTKLTNDSDSRESFSSVDSDPQSQLHTSQLQRRSDRCLRSDEDRSSVDSDRQSQLHTSQLPKRTLQIIQSDEEDRSSVDSDRQSQLHTSQIRRNLKPIESDEESQLQKSSSNTETVNKENQGLERSRDEEERVANKEGEDSKEGGREEQNHSDEEMPSRPAEVQVLEEKLIVEEGSNDSIDFLNFESQMIEAKPRSQNSDSNSASAYAGIFEDKQNENEGGTDNKIASDNETDIEEITLRNDTDLDESGPQKNDGAAEMNVDKQEDEDDTDVEDSKSPQNEETNVGKQADENDTDVEDSKSPQIVEEPSMEEPSKSNQEVDGLSKSNQDVDELSKSQQDERREATDEEGIKVGQSTSPKGDASSDNDSDAGTSRNREEVIRRSRRCKASRTKEDRDRVRNSRAKKDEESDSDSDGITRSKTKRHVIDDDSDSSVAKPHKRNAKKPLIEGSTSESNSDAKIVDSDTDVEGNLANKSSDFESSIVKRKSLLDVTDDVIPCTQENRSDVVIPATQEVKKPSSSEESFKLGLTQFMEDSSQEDSQRNEELYVIKDLQDDVVRDDDLIARSQRVMDKLYKITDELNEAAKKSGETNQLQIATRGLIEATKDLNKGMTSSKLERTISQDELNMAAHRLQDANDKMQVASKPIIDESLQSDEDDELFAEATQKISRNSEKIGQESGLATQKFTANIHEEDHSKDENTDKEESTDNLEATQVEDATQIEDFNAADTSSFIVATQQDNEAAHPDSNIFLEATQKVDNETAEKEATQTDANIFLVATQKVDTLKCSTPVRRLQLKRERDEDIFVAATQKATGSNVAEGDDTDVEDEVADSSIFLPATQKADVTNDGGDIEEVKDNDVTDSSIFLLATQKADETNDGGNTEEVKDNDVTDSSIFLLATQKADVTNDGGATEVKDNDVSDSSIFLLATQKADVTNDDEDTDIDEVKEDGDIDEPSKPTVQQKEPPMQLNASSDEDEMFEMATQQLPKQSKPNPLVSNLEKTVGEEEKVATQNSNVQDAIFEEATQKISNETTPDGVFLVPGKKLDAQKVAAQESLSSRKNETSRKHVSFGTVEFHDEDDIEITGRKVDEGCFKETSEENREKTKSSKASEDERHKEDRVEESCSKSAGRNSSAKKDLEVESQLEVLFATQTLHAIEEDSDRPENPLAASFNATSTQDIVNRLSLIHGDEESSKKILDTQDVLTVLSSNEEIRNKEEIICSTQDVINTLSSNKEVEQRKKPGGSSKLSLKLNNPTHSPVAKPNFRKLSLSTVKPSTSKEESVTSKPSTSEEEEVFATTTPTNLNDTEIRSRRNVKPLKCFASEEESATKIEDTAGEEALVRSRRITKPLKSSTSEEERSFAKPAAQEKCVKPSAATKIPNEDTKNEETAGRSKRNAKPLKCSASEEECVAKSDTKILNEETLGRSRRNTKPLKSSTSEEESFASTSGKLDDNNEANKSNRLPDSSVVTRKKPIIVISDDEAEDILITVPKKQISLKIKEAKPTKQSKEKKQPAELKVPARRGRKKKSPEPEAHLESKRRKTDSPEASSEEKNGDAKTTGGEGEEKVGTRRGRRPLDKNVGQEESAPRARRGRRAATKDSQDSEENDGGRGRVTTKDSADSEENDGTKKDLEEKPRRAGRQDLQAKVARRQSVDEDFEDKEETEPKRSRLQNIELAAPTRRGRKASVKEESSTLKEDAKEVTASRPQRGRRAVNKESQEPQNSGSKLQRSKRSLVMEEVGKEEEAVNKRGRKAASKDEDTTPMLAKRSRKFEDDDSGPSSSASSLSVLSTPKRRGAASLLGSPSISTPERAKRKLKPKIVFTMLDSPELCTIIRSLGGMIVDSLEASTVLVTKSVLRTQKLLCAVGLGKPICSPDWLYACKKANTFLDPWDHLIQDPEAEKKWSFSLQESFDRSRNEKLFSEYSFQLIVNNASDVLKGAIESCGGKCVSRSPKSGQLIVIASPENKAKCSKFFKQKIQVVLPEAIFDGVLRQEIVFDKHFLSSS